MRFTFSSNLESLAEHLPRFVELVGKDALVKRLDDFDRQQTRSPFLWKIVSDYHWLEMGLGFQADALERTGRLQEELIDPQIMAALLFASATMEIYDRLGDMARTKLQGRLRDALKAETGFAALYFEIDLARKIIVDGYDVEFPDLEDTGQFDIKFSRSQFVGEIECKSLSADAGRQIHRKDFYRFMQSLSSSVEKHLSFQVQELLFIKLSGRLSPSETNQAELRRATAYMLEPGAPPALNRNHFQIERTPYRDILGDVDPTDQRQLYAACTSRYGHDCHIAGGLSQAGGCLIVMKSEREDDTSKPWLEAMRKASSQFSGHHPSFIAVQFQDISATDMMSVNLRRRAGILSYGLFGHYGADHVNAMYITGYAAVVYRDGQFGAPAFAIPNPKPRFVVEPRDVSPFLVSLTDAEYANAIGAPLPQPNISDIRF